MHILLIILGILWVVPSQADDLLVIASPEVPLARISAKQLADIYMLKKRFWADQTQAIPVNRESSAIEREKFSEALFDLSPQELAEYWNRLSFQGKFPPLIQTSDEAVLGFVRSVPGAIGYINADQPTTGVKVLLRLP